MVIDEVIIDNDFPGLAVLTIVMCTITASRYLNKCNGDQAASGTRKANDNHATNWRPPEVLRLFEAAARSCNRCSERMHARQGGALMTSR